MTLSRDDIRQAIFGISDGAATTVGAMFGLYASGHRNAILIATLSAGLSATESMATGEYLSDDTSSIRRALAMAGGTAIGGLTPAIPFIFTHSITALILATVICIALGAWVGHARSQVVRPALAYTQAYAIFVLVGISTYVLGVLL